MTLAPLAAADAARLIAAGAILVDVREPDERARARIPSSRHAPLSRLPKRLDADGATALVFHCRSGMRTQGNAAQLAAAAGGTPAYALDGGLDAWRAEGLPVAEDRRQPIEVMRQVQIAAGALVLLGVLGSVLVAPVFLALSAFIGAGLVFAGSTGWCGMAQLIRRMPWNRRSAAA